MQKYYIYCITNKINDKKYIGWTADFDNRKHSHITESFNIKQPSYNTIFHRAIRKYGIENFDWSILYISWCQEHIKEMEIYFIGYMKTHCINGYGYNMTSGGEGTKNIFRSEKARYNMSIAQSGKKLSLYHKQKIKERMNCPEIREYLRQKTIEQFNDPIKKENFRLARLAEKNPAFGKLWIHKDDIHKRIDPLILEEYLTNGWIKGRINKRKQK